MSQGVVGGQESGGHIKTTDNSSNEYYGLNVYIELFFCFFLNFQMFNNPVKPQALFWAEIIKYMKGKGYNVDKSEKKVILIHILKW
jgi:hypothetical protein